MERAGAGKDRVDFVPEWRGGSVGSDKVGRVLVGGCLKHIEQRLKSKIHKVLSCPDGQAVSVSSQHGLLQHMPGNHRLNLCVLCMSTCTMTN